MFCRVVQVLEPNYRRSTGYGDQFVKEIRYRPLSLPGKDILSGVDQLIRDGIVDPYRLTVGGYSYAGFLTSWLITQTKCFNAALSGAGSTNHNSAWGTMDLHVLITDLFGGYPWKVPHIYQNEAPIYQLDRVGTPTLISTGESDIRVPISPSYIMERGLHYRGAPAKLITFPNEELKWLKQYDNQL
jgi:dipeptidyl aminopeptidase/acylaminoacyl peptidase